IFSSFKNKYFSKKKVFFEWQILFFNGKFLLLMGFHLAKLEEKIRKNLFFESGTFLKIFKNSKNKKAPITATSIIIFSISYRFRLNKNFPKLKIYFKLFH